jgi:hypothetical protein
MIRSLSLRSRFAAASARASAEPAFVPADRGRLLEDRVPVARVRLPPLARLLLARLLLARPLLARPLPADLAVPERVLRDPLLEPVLLDPPLLACGMLPPWYELGDLRAPYLAASARWEKRLSRSPHLSERLAWRAP